MKLKAPKLRKITEISVATTLQSNCDLWEISVPPRDDVVWSIVLSYLISEDFQPPQDLHNRLKILTGNDANKKAVEKFITLLNPFLDKNICFGCDAMYEVVHDFKTKLNWDKQNMMSNKFEAASNLLNRRIYVIGDGILFDTNINNKERSFDEQETIVLFSSSESGERVFSFGINAVFCRKKREETMLYYLEQIESFSRIPLSHIQDLVTDEEDLLISLLKSDYAHLVPDLLDTPAVISKATELGYSSGIRSVDSDGLSPLYHAIMNCDTRICYSVYYFAVKGFQLTDSYRSPTSQNVRNLHNIDKILSNDQTKSNNFEKSSNPETSEILFYSVLHFNKFLMEITKKLLYFNTEILEIKRLPRKKLLLATTERQKMLSILDTYLEYFNSIELRHNKVNFHDDLNGFIKCKNYCQTIDIVTCLFFFDHIHHLKKLFAVPNIYPDMESDFFILALTYVILGKVVESGSFQTLQSFLGDRKDILHKIPLNIRNETVANVKRFCEKLKSFQTTPQNETLNEFSFILQKSKEIRDYLKCRRLETYFSAAETIQSWSQKSTLVIERVLQVIGENLIIERKIGKERFQWFFYLYLPQDIGKLLFDLRNRLSHYDLSSFTSRILSENQFFNFRGMQREISVLHDYLKPFFNIIYLNLNAYVSKELKFCLKRLKLSKTYRNELLRHHRIQCIPEKTFRECYHSIHHVFSVILSRIDIELDKNRPDSYINKMIYPLIGIIKSVQELLHPNDKKLLKESKFSSFFPFLKNVYERDKKKSVCVELKKFLDTCKIFVDTKPDAWKNFEGTEKKVTDIEEIRAFQLILNCTKLTDTEKGDLNGEMADFVLQHKFIIPFDTSNILKQLPSLTAEEQRKFRLLYGFPYYLRNIADSMKLDACMRMCITEMKFSNKERKFLQKLFFFKCEKTEQKYFIKGSLKLLFLLQRIYLIENILIAENIENLRLWMDQGEKNEREFLENVSNYFLSNSEVKASIEMIFLDCMELFGRTDDQLWHKMSGMYDGIYLRNVIAHGDLLLENVCEQLDPLDLPLEILKNVVDLIRDKGCIVDILNLYCELDGNIFKLENVIKYPNNDREKYLSKYINMRGNKERYINLLKENDEKKKDELILKSKQSFSQNIYNLIIYNNLMNHSTAMTLITIITMISVKKLFFHKS